MGEKEIKSRNNKRERNTVGERDRLTRIACANEMTSAWKRFVGQTVLKKKNIKS